MANQSEDNRRPDHIFLIIERSDHDSNSLTERHYTNLKTLIDFASIIELTIKHANQRGKKVSDFEKSKIAMIGECRSPSVKSALKEIVEVYAKYCVECENYGVKTCETIKTTAMEQNSAIGQKYPIK
jgi:hypothetical protein